jgi:hypothetical protein
MERLQLAELCQKSRLRVNCQWPTVGKCLAVASYPGHGWARLSTIWSLLPSGFSYLDQVKTVAHISPQPLGVLGWLRYWLRASTFLYLKPKVLNRGREDRRWGCIHNQTGSSHARHTQIQRGRHTRILYTYPHVINYRHLTHIPASRIIIIL